MELTDYQLEKVRAAARTVDYGSVTINISATSNKLDLSIQQRIRLDDEDATGGASGRALRHGHAPHSPPRRVKP